ncbi:MAG: lamin tail domain-containing protein [Candidatus Poseidoniales archaeon]|nr:MAG: lamin tail domain-containing protein [Candidatus Poseidoniales archaeon]
MFGGNLMNPEVLNQSMRTKARRTLAADEGGLTAVIEFLSAFTLFLMILTAFISLAQLQMGPNDPEVDRLDRAAAIGLDRLTGGEGWFVPYDASGGLDVDNGTSDWHELDAATLTNGRLQAGLLGDGIVDDHRISALRNVTETGMAQGLGLGEGLSLHLSITVQQHTDANQTGSVLFEGGTERARSPASSTAYRQFHQDGRVLQIVLEVHNRAQKFDVLELSEVMTRPAAGGPEWIELRNPNDFAVALRGWSLNHTSGSATSNVLFQEGVVSGGGLAVLSGDPSTQSYGNASEVIDLGQSGFLGVGSLNGLDDRQAILSLRYTQLEQVTPSEVGRTSWGGDTGLFMVTGQSLAWDGADRYAATSWSVSDAPSPGDV